ncbi:unnamed protein product [Vicia faba]|uniref:Uncharacterized protein n=1 Tax=Vicia faba TaxID=3906 RepID=A0AAV0ZIW2_VICFA|nr:unnamed protein product [Vicia faba]
MKSESVVADPFQAPTIKQPHQSLAASCPVASDSAGSPSKQRAGAPTVPAPGSTLAPFGLEDHQVLSFVDSGLESTLALPDAVAAYTDAFLLGCLPLIQESHLGDLLRRSYPWSRLAHTRPTSLRGTSLLCHHPISLAEPSLLVLATDPERPKEGEQVLVNLSGKEEMRRVFLFEWRDANSIRPCLYGINYYLYKEKAPKIDSLRASSLAGDLANFFFPGQDSCHQAAPLERGPSETHAIKKKSLELNH